eukprot:459453-Rhodomonas_salina.1
MPLVWSKGLGGRLRQFLVGDTDLTRLSDGCLNALNNDLVTLLGFDVQREEIRPQGLIPDGPSDAIDERECVDAAHDLDVLCCLPLLCRQETVILVPSSRELEEVESATGLVPGDAVGAPILLVHLPRKVLLRPREIKWEVTEGSLVPQLPPREVQILEARKRSLSYSVVGCRPVLLILGALALDVHAGFSRAGWAPWAVTRCVFVYVAKVRVVRVHVSHQLHPRALLRHCPRPDCLGFGE